MKKVISAWVMLALCSIVTVVAAEEKAIPIDQLPAKIVEAVKAKFPGATLKEASKEENDDEILYEVVLEKDGKQLDVTVSDDAEIEYYESEVGLNDVPKAVKEALEKLHPKAKLVRVDGIYEFEDEQSTAELDFYEAELKAEDGSVLEVKLNSDGSAVEDEDSEQSAADDEEEFTSDFSFEKKYLKSTGSNAYFSLEPGFQSRYEGGDETLVITVLEETKKIDDVETRVVEERETKAGKLVEVSRNFFAISSESGNVYYFGEEVDVYKDGKVAHHEGSWLAGKDGAQFGLAMPAVPLLGARFQIETAPKIAMDRAEIVSLNETASVPAGKYSKCLKVEETNPLEPDSKEFKLYAPGVGLIVDGPVKLVSQGKAKSN